MSEEQKTKGKEVKENEETRLVIVEESIGRLITACGDKIINYQPIHIERQTSNGNVSLRYTLIRKTKKEKRKL